MGRKWSTRSEVPEASLERDIPLEICFTPAFVHARLGLGVVCDKKELMVPHNVIILYSSFPLWIQFNCVIGFTNHNLSLFCETKLFTFSPFLFQDEQSIHVRLFPLLTVPLGL